MDDASQRPTTPTDPETVIRRILADPVTIRENRDGGAAAAEFIRDAVATRCGAALTPEQRNEREKARQAHLLDLLAEIRRVSDDAQPEAEAGG